VRGTDSAGVALLANFAQHLLLTVEQLLLLLIIHERPVVDRVLSGHNALEVVRGGLMRGSWDLT